MCHLVTRAGLMVILTIIRPLMTWVFSLLDQNDSVNEEIVGVRVTLNIFKNKVRNIRYCVIYIIILNI